ncbi:hypothetical protein N7E02_08690 [Aliirhizobium terrae]|uniref:DUF2946 family protein n=1 Tax=Terrirhizobium terrae TaxID=2926709 RepID=UPI0025772E6D|nr:DUF2946 family protein [Rhizobium sp. CC-CFT758]WJH40670.1 hypothetical protein N7E02_08690 [Rhizobium sp. CC-CFT758]
MFRRHASAMRFFRQLISDATCGGPLAALIGVLMALQALIGGIGTGTMAFASVEQAIICSDGAPEAAHHQSHGGSDKSDSTHKRDCCLTACQIAASVHVGIPAKAPSPAASAAMAPLPGLVLADIDLRPHRLVLSRAARGPPGSPV